MMPGRCQWFTLSLVVLNLVCCHSEAWEQSGVRGDNEENRLWRYLFEESSYNHKVRPLHNISRPINLTFDVAVNQIIDFDEPKMILVSEIWVRLYWRDEMLMWNASDFGGLTSIQVPARDVWLPDLCLFSNVDASADGIFGNINFMVIISSNGDVMWLYPRVIQCPCSVNMELFPFDTQHCSHEFGSWSYSGHYIDIYPRNPKGDSSNYISNGEWDLVDLPSRREVKMYHCCPEPYPSVTYTYVLRRRPTYYIFNLTLPCFLITLVSLFSFLLPAESGEKIAMNITTLLTVVVFMMMIADFIPPQGTVIPIIQWYFGACIVLLCMSTAATVFTYRMHFKGEYGTPFPVWGRRVLYGPIGQTLGISRNTDASKQLEKNKVDILQTKIAVDETPITDNGVLSSSNNGQMVNLQNDVITVPEVQSVNVEPNPRWSSRQDWKDLVRCIDKLFFVAFFVLNVGLSSFVFFYFWQ